ncbi:MAG: hypothetical protein HFJ57_02030 [Clostridia bacterium]|nr:hypothetical protein [Clostridia bacterium]
MENKELLLQILKNTEDLKTRLDKVEENSEKRFVNLESRLDHIEKTHGERLQNIEKTHGERLQNIEKTHGERLENIENTHGKRLQNIENIVTRMEKEHGEKIQILFDYFVDQDSKNKRINSRIHRLCKKSDEHDTRIFALEFYKSEKLVSK